jgi:hypothetical protein
MKRALAAAVLAGGVALALGACSGDDDGGYGFSASSGGGTGACQQYTTCGTCTPVDGCGWCFTANGGACASGPDQCASASEFSWTWDPTGCPDFDAQVGPPLEAGGGEAAPKVDAADASEAGSKAEAGSTEAGAPTEAGGASEAGAAPAEAGPPTDAGSGE